jgi:hypothetical protein
MEEHDIDKITGLTKELHVRLYSGVCFEETHLNSMDLHSSSRLNVDS